MSMLTTSVRTANPERRFYQGMILVVIACIVLGFSRTFFLRPLFPDAHAPTEIFFYAHGMVVTIWLGLLLTQASLIGVGNVTLHRRLGTAGFVLVPLIVIMGIIGGLIAAKRPGGFIDIPVPPLIFLVVPFYLMALFAGLAGTGLALRRNPQTHKRLILLSTIAMAEAGIARWPFEPYTSSPHLVFWTTAALVVPMVGWDFYSRKRIHPATLIGGLLIVSEETVRDLISSTPQWMTFAKWATGMLG